MKYLIAYCIKNKKYYVRYLKVCRIIYVYTQTPCGFLLVGTAVSNCLGEPIILRVLPGLWVPIYRNR